MDEPNQSRTSVEDATKRLPSASCPPNKIVRLFVAEYEYRGNRWHTVVEAHDLESAKRQFRRENPGVEVVSCY